jgi:hypothetical protein
MRVYRNVVEAHDRKAAGVMGALLASMKAQQFTTYRWPILTAL